MTIKIKKLITQLLPSKEKTTNQSIKRDINKIQKIILSIIGIFIIWSFFAQIDHAVVARGVFIPNTKKKIIQHADNGIVEEILVNEGEIVKSGQVLVKLNPSHAKSNYEANEYSLSTKKIELARIKSEISFNKSIDLSNIKKEIEENKLNSVIENEKTILLNNIALFNNKKDSLLSREKQFKTQIASYKSQIKSIKDRIDMLYHEKIVLDALRRKKMADNDKMLNIKKELSVLKSESDSLAKSIDQSTEGIKETLSEIKTLESNRLKELHDMYHKISTDIAELEIKSNYYSDVYERTSVKSPVDGIVTAINLNGGGQNINSNTNIMEIIPLSDKLIIEAKVQPRDIAIIKKDMYAKITLILPDHKINPYLKGKVSYIGYDVRTEQSNPNVQYFLVKIEVNDEDLQKIPYKIIPGMSTDVFIKIGERPFIKYILDPIIRSFRLSFNE